jgi:hypothetical protein
VKTTAKCENSHTYLNTYKFNVIQKRQKERENEEENLISYWMAVRKTEDTGI